MVLACHANFSWAEGGYVGLDIFFVLSGFLITGLVLGEYRKTGTISIRNFYARRAKRLLPMASSVLLVVVIGSLIIFAPVRQVETAGDVLAAALYFVNWAFIAQGVDYFASAEGLASPVQHYWSLSVEEQFYLVWPVLILGCTVLATKIRRNARLVAFLFILLVAAASLTYSVIYTPINPEAAYFSSLTRVWELAFGAILALVLPSVTRIRVFWANVLVGGGIAAIMISGFLLTEIDPYPGWRALFPVLGTSALIIGGSSYTRGIFVKFLALPLFQYFGKISYAVYLWHWPFIVFAIALFGDLEPGWLVVVTLLSWIPAEITHRLIEEPLRRSKRLNVQPRRALAVGAVFSFVAIGSALTLGATPIDVSRAPESQVAGAAAIKKNVPVQKQVTQVRPLPTETRDDRGEAFDEGCLIIGPITESPECRFDFGDENAKRIVLFGDSHALQYAPTLIEIARNNGWNLTVLTRGNCLPADTEFKHYCDTWRGNALERIEQEEKPDLTVVAASTMNVYSLKDGDRELSRDESQPLLVEAMAETFERLQQASGEVVLIRDQARAPFLPFECVAESPKNLMRCAFEPQRRSEWAFDYEGARQAGVPIIDPMPVLCNKKLCPSVIGDVLVYRDTYHLSATYARSIAPWLRTQLNKLD